MFVGCFHYNLIFSFIRAIHDHIGLSSTSERVLKASTLFCLLAVGWPRMNRSDAACYNSLSTAGRPSYFGSRRVWRFQRWGPSPSGLQRGYVTATVPTSASVFASWMRGAQEATTRPSSVVPTDRCTMIDMEPTYHHRHCYLFHHSHRQRENKNIQQFSSVD